MMLMRIIVGTLLIFCNILYATDIDSDLDGVPDRIDECPNTPFFMIVDNQGCIKDRLYLPEDNQYKSLIFSLGYGYITDDDLIGGNRENIVKLKINYYGKNYSLSLNSAYYTYFGKEGLLDTTVKVMKYFQYKDDWRVGFGLGVKLPTYDFAGNKSDYILSTNIKNFISKDMRIFAGYDFTIVNDEVNIKLRDSSISYIGIGNFFTKKFYANLSFIHQVSKFRTQENNNMLSTTLYYKINESYFATLSYQRDFWDEDRHDSLILKVNYKIW